jgi:hypothetical protein
MKNFCLTALLLGLSLCVAGVCAQTPAKNKASVLKAYDDLNNQNARTWGVLSANLIPLPDPIPYWPQRKGGSGGTLRAIELGFVEYFRSFPDAHWTVERATAEGTPSWSATKPNIRLITPDVALLTSEVVSDIKLKGGQQVGGKSTFALLLRRAGGKWLIEFDSQTPVLQMPPAGN